MGGYVLAIDQGTTSSRAIVFDGNQKVVGSGQKEFTQIFPQSGWVEHDPEEIWESVVWSVKAALKKAGVKASDIAAIGITNQRETVVVWERESGRPIHNAIVWQDRRTASYCEKLKKQDLEKTFTKKTGLLLDPYFSGTKLSWMLSNVKGARARGAKGDLCFGTIDTFLIWRLTGGRSHVTDATNASRTLMYNIAANEWDDELLEILRVPKAMLPEVLDCAADFGVTEKGLFGAEIPILGVAGDQQAATIGQACFEPGMMKSTYGTGCFALLNTGPDMVRSKNRLLTTIAYRLDGETTYALEGSIFIAGAAVQWLRDGLKVIKAAPDTGDLAAKADPTQNVYLVPAFTGLGAPHWDPEARAAIYGMTRNTGPAEFARAALE
ncbi:MAG: glycerol kinase, partial [Rhizobiales bacterium]|nr:glycerol kinase [Hyphomicrobiales bacterium]